MRWIVLLSLLISVEAYSGPYIPCIPGETRWDDPETIFCPTLTTVITFALTSIYSYDLITNTEQKIILNSKDHATIYVVSNGEINSAYLEQALVILRKEYPNASDMELAKAILAY